MGNGLHMRALAMSMFERYSKKIPSHIVGEFRDYLTDGKRPNDFCMAVLVNDLKTAASLADAICLANLGTLAGFMILGLPDLAQGNSAKVQHWITSGGLNGLYPDSKG